MEPDILNLLKDKTALIGYLCETIQREEKNVKGLLEMKERGFSTEGMLDNVIKVTARQSQEIKHLALIALIFSSSSAFDASVAHILNKMGRGEEALRAMMEAKFNK